MSSSCFHAEITRNGRMFVKLTLHPDSGFIGKSKNKQMANYNSTGACSSLGLTVNYALQA